MSLSLIWLPTVENDMAYSREGELERLRRTIPTFTIDWDDLSFSLIRRHLAFSSSALLLHRWQAKTPAGSPVA
jgi:hypothetical protein